jgi:DNA (cytosine-5)-methyltransferase 1
MKIVSLFSGCGGLDLGFESQGFKIIWSNENDKTIHLTYKANFPNTKLDTRSIIDIPSDEIPDCDGIIGGPPCQSWSAAGSHKGFEDKRGNLFFEFIRVIKDKQPKFFVAENVEGLLRSNNKEALARIIEQFEAAGYVVSHTLLNASSFGVPQDRKRVFFIGMKGIKVKLDDIPKEHKTLHDAIFDIKDNAIKSNGWNSNHNVSINAHEYISETTNGYSSQYMSRNRVRGWDEFGYTVPASGRHVTQHPSAPKMVKVEGSDLFEFVNDYEYRRFTVRECARIQTFPDTFKLLYDKVNNGYKMIGNAVPVKLASVVANEIKKYL